MYGARTKHMDIRCHFVREKMEEQLVKMEWIAHGLNPADGLMKPLGKRRSSCPFDGWLACGESMSKKVIGPGKQKTCVCPAIIEGECQDGHEGNGHVTDVA